METPEETYQKCVDAKIQGLAQFNKKNNLVEVPYNWRELKAFCEFYYSERLKIEMPIDEDIVKSGEEIVQDHAIGGFWHGAQWLKNKLLKGI